jgi:hypothetical protein
MSSFPFLFISRARKILFLAPSPPGSVLGGADLCTTLCLEEMPLLSGARNQPRHLRHMPLRRGQYGSLDFCGVKVGRDRPRDAGGFF